MSETAINQNFENKKNQNTQDLYDYDSGITCPNCGGSMIINNGYRICEDCDYAEYND